MMTKSFVIVNENFRQFVGRVSAWDLGGLNVGASLKNGCSAWRSSRGAPCLAVSERSRFRKPGRKQPWGSAGLWSEAGDDWWAFCRVREVDRGLRVLDGAQFRQLRLPLSELVYLRVRDPSRRQFRRSECVLRRRFCSEGGRVEELYDIAFKDVAGREGGWRASGFRALCPGSRNSCYKQRPASDLCFFRPGRPLRR